MMEIVYAGEPLPRKITRSVFLAGPTPRSPDVKSWRPEALFILEKGFEFDGTVFVPEPRPETGSWPEDYRVQIRWEDEALNMSDCIVFWVPRELETMPAFTTNHEHGEWFKSQKTVLGCPRDAPKMRYLIDKGLEYGEPVRHSLGGVGGVLAVAADRTMLGSERVDGECSIPLLIWHTKVFQRILGVSREAGNRIAEARVQWVHRDGPDLLWLMLVTEHVAETDKMEVRVWSCFPQTEVRVLEHESWE